MEYKLEGLPIWASGFLSGTAVADWLLPCPRLDQPDERISGAARWQGGITGCHGALPAPDVQILAQPAWFHGKKHADPGHSGVGLVRTTISKATRILLLIGLAGRCSRPIGIRRQRLHCGWVGRIPWACSSRNWFASSVGMAVTVGANAFQACCQSRIACA